MSANKITKNSNHVYVSTFWHGLSLTRIYQFVMPRTISNSDSINVILECTVPSILFLTNTNTHPSTHSRRHAHPCTRTQAHTHTHTHTNTLSQHSIIFFQNSKKRKDTTKNEDEKEEDSNLWKTKLNKIFLQYLHLSNSLSLSHSL